MLNLVCLFVGSITDFVTGSIRLALSTAAIFFAQGFSASPPAPVATDPNAVVVGAAGGIGVGVVTFVECSGANVVAVVTPADIVNAPPPPAALLVSTGFSFGALAHQTWRNLRSLRRFGRGSMTICRRPWNYC